MVEAFVPSWLKPAPTTTTTTVPSTTAPPAERAPPYPYQASVKTGGGGGGTSPFGGATHWKNDPYADRRSSSTSGGSGGSGLLGASSSVSSFGVTDTTTNTHAMLSHSFTGLPLTPTMAPLPGNVSPLNAPLHANRVPPTTLGSGAGLAPYHAPLSTTTSSSSSSIPPTHRVGSDRSPPPHVNGTPGWAAPVPLSSHYPPSSTAALHSPPLPSTSSHGFRPPPSPAIYGAGSVGPVPISPSLADYSPQTRLPTRMKSPMWVPPSPATVAGGGAGGMALPPPPSHHFPAPLSSRYKSSSHVLNPNVLEFTPLLPSTTAATAAAAAAAAAAEKVANSTTAGSKSGRQGVEGDPYGYASRPSYTPYPAPSQSLVDALADSGASPDTEVGMFLGAASFDTSRTLQRVILQRPAFSSAVRRTSFMPTSARGGGEASGRGGTAAAVTAASTGRHEDGKTRGGEGEAGAESGMEELNDASPMTTFAGKFRDLWKLHYLPRKEDRWGGKEEGYHPLLAASIEDIPTFWRVFNNIPVPTVQKTGTLYFFRDDIDPKWEDKANKGGGILRMTVQENVVDAAWELLLLRAVGSSWTRPGLREVVNGIAIKLRESSLYILELWVTMDTVDLRQDLHDLFYRELGMMPEMSYMPFSQNVTAASNATPSTHPNNNNNTNNNNNNNSSSHHHGSGSAGHNFSKKGFGMSELRANPLRHMANDRMGGRERETEMKASKAYYPSGGSRNATQYSNPFSTSAKQGWTGTKTQPPSRFD